ncbi:hypothetical protein BDW69DRAFT_203348 [Aspergillus filifer]
MPTEYESLEIYESSIHLYGLNIANWSREIFTAWHEGDITGVSCTCGIWENFRGSIANVVQWKKSFEEHSDLIIQAHNARDIRRAKETGKTAVLLSWQNTAGIEDNLDYLRVFRDLGLRDGGLTGFGRQVVDELAKLGIVCDLSHVGPATHVLPGGLKAHPRNKSDELIWLLGAKGGFIGLSQFGPHMERGNESKIDDYVAALDYVIGLIGENLVGVGSDASEGHARPSEFMAWCNMDNGYARKLTPWGARRL